MRCVSPESFLYSSVKPVTGLLPSKAGCHDNSALRLVLFTTQRSVGAQVFLQINTHGIITVGMKILVLGLCGSTVVYWSVLSTRWSISPSAYAPRHFSGWMRDAYPSRVLIHRHFQINSGRVLSEFLFCLHVYLLWPCLFVVCCWYVRACYLAPRAVSGVRPLRADSPPDRCTSPYRLAPQSRWSGSTARSRHQSPSRCRSAPSTAGCTGRRSSTRRCRAAGGPSRRTRGWFGGRAQQSHFAAGARMRPGLQSLKGTKQIIFKLTTFPPPPLESGLTVFKARIFPSTSGSWVGILSHPGDIRIAIRSSDYGKWTNLILILLLLYSKFYFTWPLRKQAACKQATRGPTL